MTPLTRRVTIVSAFLLTSCAAGLARGQQRPGAKSRLPPYLDEVRRAAVAWERRPGPARRVVDMVCLVPDLPTFLEAIATWDDAHWFPILIDDVEYSFKFLRAFRPARVVRFPRKAAAIPDGQAWARAVAAVRRARTAGDSDAAEPPGAAGAGEPRGGQDPPGVVLSSPDSPMLAGAVALAAGRAQPLLRFETTKHFVDVLSADEARELAAKFENVIADAVGRYDRIGDDCDFVTLAGDYPFRYSAREERGTPFDVMNSFRRRAGGPHALDDLVGRSADGMSRWAFEGRLLGDAKLSVYRAMCSLFLQPKAALVLNTYDEKDPAWGSYAMHTAARRLAALLPVTDRSGERASLCGWHQAFDPVNRFGLVMINTHGEPIRFHVTGGTGITADVPQSEPAAVVMIHSFSAADPLDPGTIAGRWLANGAFLYFGSMNEPGLQSFRTPDLVAALMAEGMPLGAATRQSPPEPFGRPWRLVYLGDPLYRVNPLPEAPRTGPDGWPAVAAWPRYEHFARPAAGADDAARLRWAVKEGVAQFLREPSRSAGGRLADELLAIRRSRLDAHLRPFLDALLADTLLQAKRPGTLHAQLVHIPAAERTAEVARVLETCQILLMQQAAANHDFPRVQAIWSEMVRSGASPQTLEQITARVGTLMADSPIRRGQWRSLLVAAQRLLKDAPGAEVIANERKRIEALR